MATSITNLSFVEKSQQAINAITGFADDTKPFAKGFNPSTVYGNGVSVPVFKAGTVSTNLAFTDGSDSVAFVDVLVNKAATKMAAIPAHQYAQIEQYSGTYIPGLVSRVLNQVTDDAYGMFNTTNWAIASNKVVSAAWVEATPTLAALEVAVQAAIKTKTLDKSNIMVLMPSTTYAVIKSALNALNRDIKSALGYDIIPVYAASLTQSAITDGSAVGIGIGLDMPTPGTAEEFDYLTDANTSFGMGFHVFGDAASRNVNVALSAVYGVSVLNTTGFKWIAAS